jgi:hypothetical protein
MEAHTNISKDSDWDPGAGVGVRPRAGSSSCMKTAVGLNAQLVAGKPSILAMHMKVAIGGKGAR